MGQCRATKANGERCKGTADGPDSLCWHHDPATAAERQRRGSRGGKSKPSREVKQLKSEVRDLIEDIRGGSLDRADGQTMLQGYRVLREFVALERTIAEEDELRVRLDELEDALSREGAGGKRSWG